MTLIQISKRGTSKCIICHADFFPHKDYIKCNACKSCYIAHQLKKTKEELTNAEGVAIVDALAIIRKIFEDLNRNAWNEQYSREGLFLLQNAYQYLNSLVGDSNDN